MFKLFGNANPTDRELSERLKSLEQEYASTAPRADEASGKKAEEIQAQMDVIRTELEKRSSSTVETLRAEIETLKQQKIHLDIQGRGGDIVQQSQAVGEKIAALQRQLLAKLDEEYARVAPVASSEAGVQAAKIQEEMEALRQELGGEALKPSV